MLKLRRFKKGEWFDYPGAKGVRFLIRPVQGTVGLDIQKRIRKAVPIDIPSIRDPKRKITTLLEDINTAEMAWEVFDYMLEDFEGIEVEGDEGPITDKVELKKAIFGEPSLQEFISAKSEELVKIQSSKMEEEIKNSNSSQGG
jgi:hypothetical protein